jgi:ribosomal protein S12 methylthiotransferase accessory factor
MPPIDSAAAEADSDRAVPPADTVAKLRPHLATMGITRLADLTGLDRIGVPVFASVRPNSRSVATSQGKGLTADAARAAALMESVETWHAERVDGPLRFAGAAELRGSRLIDLNGLPRRAGRHFDPDRPILWGEGVDLSCGEPVWLPYELVHTDYRLPQPPAAGCFPVGTNGLAAGNTHAEGLRHALCELIERDAQSLWYHRSAKARLARRVDLTRLAEPRLRALVDQIAGAGFDLALFDITSDLAVPCFLAVLADSLDPAGHPGLGSACHPAAVRAAGQALLEAVQVRTTYIAGARDDLAPEEFEADGPRAKLRWVEGLLRANRDGVPLRLDPPVAKDDAEVQLAWLLDRLADAGMLEVVAVDLTRSEIGMPVVRLVVPGLEAASDDPDYAPGRRALAASGTA